MKLTLNKSFWEEVVKPEIIVFVKDKCSDHVLLNPIMSVEAFVSMVEIEYNINDESVCVDIKFLNQNQSRRPEEDYIIFNMIIDKIINSKDYKDHCLTLLSCQKRFLMFKNFENAFSQEENK